MFIPLSSVWATCGEGNQLSNLNNFRDAGHKRPQLRLDSKFQRHRRHRTTLAGAGHLYFDFARIANAKQMNLPTVRARISLNIGHGIANLWVQRSPLTNRFLSMQEMIQE